MDISIIIVAWNVRKFVYDCLKSIYDQTQGIAFEVIYVDNASKDGTVEMVRREFPAVHIIENSENKGFIIANNQGIEVARGRYVLLLNSDTVVLDNAIARSVKFADEHPEAAVVGCKTFNPDGTLQRSAFMAHSVLNLLLYATYLYKLFPQSRFFGREFMTWWDFEEVREVETVRGCFALVRRTAIDQVGVMDDIYFVYGDDIDWCYRFRRAGWKVLFTPDAQIIHYGGQTTKQLSRTFMFQLYGSKLLFLKKYGKPWAFPLARILLALYFLIRAPYWLFRGLLQPARRHDFLATARNYTDGAMYCLCGWTKLLMNKPVVDAKLADRQCACVA